MKQFSNLALRFLPDVKRKTVAGSLLLAKISPLKADENCGFRSFLLSSGRSDITIFVVFLSIFILFHLTL
jgi:hypothetical protein